MVDDLPLRLAPAVFGATAATEIETTTAPRRDSDTTPLPRVDLLLCTTVPDTSC